MIKTFYLLILVLGLVLVIEPSKVQATNKDYCVNLPILMYHHIQPEKQAVAKGQKSLTVTPDFFEKQIAQLVALGYKFLTLDQIKSGLNTGSLPEKALAVTLDDGYDDANFYAYPVAKKYGIPLNLFISTGLVNNPGYLSWDQIKNMRSEGLVQLYNHTWSHFSLKKADPIKVKYEVETAQKQLKENLNVENKIFAYPYGLYNSQAINILKNLGIEMAVTTQNGKRLCISNVLNLPRIRMGNANVSNYGL